MQKSIYGTTFGDTDETAPIAMTNGTPTAGAAATDVDYDQWKLNVGYKWAGGVYVFNWFWTKQV